MARGDRRGQPQPARHRGGARRAHDGGRRARHPVPRLDPPRRRAAAGRPGGPPSPLGRTGRVVTRHREKERRGGVLRNRDLAIVAGASSVSVIGDTAAVIALTLRLHAEGNGGWPIAALLLAATV